MGCLSLTQSAPIHRATPRWTSWTPLWNFVADGITVARSERRAVDLREENGHYRKLAVLYRWKEMVSYLPKLEHEARL